jgi:hypothetical protein
MAKKRCAFLLAALLVLTGCKTVPSEQLAAFSSGVSAARNQSQEAFAAVNEMIADVSLDYAAEQKHLTEASFAAGLDEASLQVWDQVFQHLGAYAQHLADLTSPTVGKEFEDETVNLSGNLKNFGEHLKDADVVAKVPQIDPSIATGFAKLGGLLIRMRAQGQARKVINEIDPEVGRILRGMADTVGASATNGIRGTVTSHWTQLLTRPKLQFLEQTNNIPARRQIATEFRDLLQRRTAQDLTLLSLRRSLLQLAELHHALAQGQSWTAQSAAAAIMAEIQQTRELNARFREKLKNK